MRAFIQMSSGAAAGWLDCTDLAIEVPLVFCDARCRLARGSYGRLSNHWAPLVHRALGARYSFDGQVSR